MWFALLNAYYSVRPRRRPPLDPADAGQISMRVLPHHLDVLRHMNNSVYATLAEAGRWDHIIRSGYAGTLRDRQWYSVITGQTLMYRRSLKLWQRFTLETGVIGMHERDVIFEHRFVREGEVHARIVAALRVLRRGGGSVPREDVLEAFPYLTAMGVPEWAQQWHATAVRPVTPTGL